MNSINIDIQGENSLDYYLVPATQKYVSWQMVLVRYRTRENKRLLSLTRSDNERREVHDSWFSQSVLFSNNYIYVCYFIVHDK